MCKYPLLTNNNNVEVPWHPGVFAGAAIKKEHDIYLLNEYF
ncbi:10532_t:CDS:2 [Entrophospora sp. SA101]|nr:10532_t:CDS:2 [Entrophospora sp. SA101]